MSGQLPLEVRFLKRYARTLHQSGVPAHQLEGMVNGIAGSLGLVCNIWSSPTAVFLSFQFPDDDEDSWPIPMQLIRLQPATINLSRTSGLYQLGERLFAGEISLESAYEVLKSVDLDKPYANWMQWLCWGLCCGSIAALLASSWLGIGVATLTGASLGVLYTQAGDTLRQGGLEPLAALWATVLVYLISHFAPGIDNATIIMSSLIIMMPGLGLTISVTELSTDHLSAGSARLAGALATLLKLALGVYLGTFLVGLLGWLDPVAVNTPLARPPDWFLLVSLLVTATGFAILFSVRPRDFPIAIGAALASYAISRLATAMAGPEMGVMLTAMCIAAGANGLSRVLNCPASLMRVPGIILLVPGSVGYRSATEFLLAGGGRAGDTGILVVTLVITLVGGLLLGNTIVPPRRPL